MASTKGRNKILLHLESKKNFKDIEDHGEAPYGICQKGIAKAVNLSRNRTSEIIRDLVKKELVEENIHRVVGLKRRRKVYSLSSKGYKKAKRLREEIENKKVKIITGSSESEIKLKQIDSYISSREPLLVALNKMDEDGTVDLTEEVKTKEDIFAGRNEEIKILEDKLSSVKENKSDTLLVKGNAGIGKTRLIMELKNRALSNGFEFFSGKGLYERSEPYLPYKIAFEKLKGTDKIYPLPLEGNERSHDISRKEIKDERKNTIFLKVTNNIQSLSKEHPIVIFIDDLQWVDRASLMLFHHLSDRLEDHPVFLIGAYRPEDVDDNDFLREMLQRMNREHLYDEVELESLRWEDTKEIIQGQIGRTDIPDEFVEMIHETAEGNPLFLKELVKQMLDEGILNPKKNKFPSKTEELKLPKVITDIIKRRIKRLDKDNLKILRLGSVIGEKMSFSLLLALSELDSFDLLEYIDVLTGLEIWEEESDEDNFSFSHGLIHSAVYENIPKMMREKLHKQVAEAMEDVFKDDLKEYYSDIGYHFRLADEHERGADYYLKAGERAEQVYAHEDALNMYEQAFELITKIENEQKERDILERLGDVNKTIGNYENSLEFYESIPKLDSDPQYQQKIHRKMASVLEREGDFMGALKTLEKGLSNRFGESLETCRLLCRKGYVEMRQGEYEAAEKDFLKAIDIAKEMGDDEEPAKIHQGLGNVYLYKGAYEKSLRHLEKSLQMWRDLSDLDGEAATLNSLGIVYLNKGDLDISLEYYTKSLDIREKMGDKRDIHSTLNNIGTIYLKKGEMDKAKKNYEKSLEIWRKIGDMQGIAISLINMGEYHLRKGDFKKSLENQRESLDISININFKKGEAASLSNIGKIHLQEGELEEAKKAYTKSLELCKKIGYKSLIANPLRGLAEVFYLEGDLEKALDKGLEALNISSEIGNKTEEGISHRILGMIFRKKGELNKATDEFEEGKNILKNIEDKKELAELFYHYSLLYKDKNEKAKKRKCLNKALRIFKNMDMIYWIKKCNQELDD